MSHKSKYFILAVIGVGTIGIWLPAWVDAEMGKEVNAHTFPLNITTTFVTIIFGGSMDYFLSKFKPNADMATLRGTIFDLLFSMFGLIILVFIATKLYINNWDYLSIVLALIGLIISWRVWWIANNENPNFNSSSSIGGEIK